MSRPSSVVPAFQTLTRGDALAKLPEAEREPWHKFWAEIAAEDSFMKLLKESVLDSPDKVRGAYYFPQWPAVHKAFNDTVTKAVTGKREDIAKVLAEGAPLVSKAAQ